MDTSAVIVAVASPPGHSPRGIIRLSGAETFRLLGAVVRDFQPDERPQRGATFSRLALQSVSLPIVVLTMPAPRSYTGEHTAELQGPGNPDLMQRIVDALIESGSARGVEVRRAEPGEFTARAYFNGRMTLTQAEGVAATIAAQSDAELRAAGLLRRGSLGRFAEDLAEDLAQALALVEAGIDFTDEEDVVAIEPRDLHARLRDLDRRVAAVLDRSVGLEELHAIPRVVLTGHTNAGKSTLFNALLGHERAVVSHLEGTTRDVLAEPLPVETSRGRAEVMLVDLAGVDPEESLLNEQMQSVAREAIAHAELILHCVPTGDPSPPSKTGTIIVRTKADLAPSSTDADLVRVSAVSGEGLPHLRQIIAERLVDRAVSLAADATALRPRHEAALRSAHERLAEAIALVAPAGDAPRLLEAELIASSMRVALDELAALAGEITPDDVLGRVFASFCIGK